MKKNGFLLIISLALLVSCNPSDNGDNSISSTTSSKVIETLESIRDNYTINYITSNGRYHIYRNQDYIYDEELGGGQFVLYDGTMYVYTIHNDIVIPHVPYSGTKADFDSHYVPFDIDTSVLEEKDDTYHTNDPIAMEALSFLTNSKPYVAADLFMDNGLLNFRFFDDYNRVVMSGTIYGINETSYKPVSDYLDSRIDPELETFKNDPLLEVLGSLNDNFTFIGQNLTTKRGITTLLTKDYVGTFEGDGSNIVSSSGIIALEDGVHYYDIVENVATVDFEIVESTDFIEKNYPFKRHDFSKFKEVATNTYVSSDYYNVQNICDLLIVEGDGINMVQIEVDPATRSAFISLMRNHSSVYEGKIFNIGTTGLPALNDYLNGTIKPTLTYYENETLIEAVKDLDTNFTYVKNLEEDETEFRGIISTEGGRKEYKDYYNNFPSTDYIVYEDYAYNYVIDQGEITPTRNKTLLREEYDATYSFKALDFHYFQPLGDNRFVTNSSRYMKILSLILGSNPYNQLQAYVTIKDDGTLEFEIINSLGYTNTSGHLEKINETSLNLIDNYKSSHDEPSFPTYENRELKEIINKMKDLDNFTIAYQDDPEYGIYFDETDYDYYTEDTIYFGTYEDGFITSSKSKYVYNFGWLVDEETETSTFTVSSHPSLSLEKVSDFNAFNRFEASMIETIATYEDDKYLSLDEEIYDIFVEAMQLGGSSYLGFCGVILEIKDENLIVSVLDEIEIEYDSDNVRHETYSVFASAIFQDIGTTEIPSFAKIPEMK